MFTSDRKEMYQRLIQLYDEGRPGVLVTVIEKEGYGPAPVGARMLVLENGTISGTVGGGSIEYKAIETATHLIAAERSMTVEYDLSEKGEVAPDGQKLGMVCGGRAKLFYEYIPAKRRVYVIGAGHVGQALIEVLSKLPYYMISIDQRPGYAENIRTAHRRIEGGIEALLSRETIPDGSIFVIAGHSHDIDYEVLENLIKSIRTGDTKPAYIGCIASKSKAKMFRERLGENFDDLSDIPLYSPIGLDIGGKTPNEIAISIAAEIQAVSHNIKGNKHMNKGEAK